MRSLNSSARRRRPFREFLDEALYALRAELPWVWRALCAALHARAVDLAVDGELVRVRGDAEGLSVTPLRAAGELTESVSLRTSRAVIVGLVEARDTFVDAVTHDRVTLRGGVDDLLAFHDALVVFLHGAVRCPSFSRLLDEFLASAEVTG
jgi:hypothetical protein